MMELAPWLVAVVAGIAGYRWGRRRGSRPWLEYQRQRELERAVRETYGPTVRQGPATTVVRRSRIARSHRWKG